MATRVIDALHRVSSVGLAVFSGASLVWFGCNLWGFLQHAKKWVPPPEAAPAPAAAVASSPPLK